MNGLAPVDGGASGDTNQAGEMTKPPVPEASSVDSAGPDSVEDAASGSTCGPSNCHGCCDVAGYCQPGDQDQGCGAGGDACEACPTTSPACIEGVCWSPGTDSGAPAIEAGAVGGASCGPLASRTRCNPDQVCCESLAAQTNSCSAPASCASDASLACSTASDCPSATPICCAQMSLIPDAMNDPPPKCTVAGLSASCAARCNESPPADATTCKYPSTGTTGTVRLCSHDVDCVSDTAATGGGCFNFNGDPVSWCSTALAGLLGTHQP